MVASVVRSLLAVVAVFAAVVSPHTPASAQDVGQWVSMGDSFSSGDGAPSYDSGTDDGNHVNDCRRTSNAYARVLSDGGRTGLRGAAYQIPEGKHVACSGGMIRDFYSGRGYETRPESDPDADHREYDDPSDNEPRCHGWFAGCDEPQWYAWGEAPQLAHLSESTELVTLTIGGNDIGFAEIVANCAMRGACGYGDTDGNGVINGDESDVVEQRIDGIAGDLARLYSDILAKAPNAHVVVLGYPRLFPDRPEDVSVNCAFERTNVVRLNGWLRYLSATIERQVQTVGDPRLRYVSVGDAFHGHETCRAGSFDEWVNPARNKTLPTDATAMHPNVKGHEALARVLRKALRDLPGGRGDGDPTEPTGTQPTAQNVDVALVIDSSGSMGVNDPQRRRIEAGRMYVSASAPGDRVGVVDFDSSARTWTQPVVIPDRRAEVLHALDRINSSGGTNIGAGVQRACNDLNALADHGQQRGAILLTDGVGAYNAQADCFAQQGWKIFSFGFGGANDSLLTEIAESTGGTYRRIEDVNSLGCEFQRVRTLIAGGEPDECQRHTIQQNESWTTTVEVAERQRLFTTSITWPGSDVELTLTSPSGVRYHRTARPVHSSHDVGATFEVMAALNPEPGAWTVSLYGAKVEEGGEEVVLSVSQVPLTGTPPTAVAEVSDAEIDTAATVTLDASQSSDADGPLTRWYWDPGDGSGLRYGDSIQHRYATPGTYTPTLTVVDGEGEAVTVEAESIAVEPVVPVVEIEATPAEGEPPLEVAFDASGSSDPDGRIIEGVWDFGDGTTSTEPFPTHTYQESGTYEVTLMLTDDSGATATGIITVDVLTSCARAGLTGPTFAQQLAGPVDEDGPVSRPAHEETEPLAGPAAPAIHEASCGVAVVDGS